MLCNIMFGVSRKYKGMYLNRVVNIGHRSVLRDDHPLRYYGMSKKCCPSGYYDGTVKSVLNLRDQALEREKLLLTVPDNMEIFGSLSAEGIAKRIRETNWVLTTEEVKTLEKNCKGNRAKSCDGYVLSEKNPDGKKVVRNSKLFNYRHSVESFEPYISYAHCDFRKQRKYKRRKTSSYKSLEGRQQVTGMIDHISDDEEVNNDSDSEIDIPTSPTVTTDSTNLTTQTTQEATQEVTTEKTQETTQTNSITNTGTTKEIPLIPVIVQLGAADIALKIYEEKRRAPISTKIKGVNRIWAFDKIPSASIRNALSYDPFHALMNLAGNLIHLLSGARGIEDGSILMCQLEKRFPGIKLKRSVTQPTNDETTKSKKKKTSAKKKTAPLRTHKTSKFQKYKKSGIPWVLTQFDQERFDAFHNCIIPTPGATKNTSKNIFGLTSALKGHDKIQLLTSYINFDVHFTDLHGSYKRLINLVSSIISDISSPVFYNECDAEDTENYLANYDLLFDRTAEMLSLIEGMFPDSEQHFTHHEILDVVFAIRRLGPIRSWWAYPGERFMKTMKDKCPEGGAQPVVTIGNYYFADENGQRFSYNVDQHKLDNLNRYRDNRIRLLGPTERLANTNWSTFCYESFMSSVYNFLECSETDSVAKMSGFYRLYRVFFAQKSNIAEFSNWLLDIRTKEDTFVGVLPEDNDDVINLIKEGHIFRDDIALIEELRNYNPNSVYSKAVIKGTDFMHFRGQHSSEIKQSEKVECKRYGAQPTQARKSKNCLNDLLSLWHKKFNSSSWCKIKSWFFDRSNDKISYKFLYGQLNYAFRFNLKHDNLLSGLAFANVTSRDPKLNIKDPMQLPHIKLRAEGNRSYFPRLQFVCLNYIESTQVTVCGVTNCTNTTKKPLPILIDKNNSDNKRMKTTVYTTDVSSIDELYFLETHPERRHVRISLADSKIIETIV